MASYATSKCKLVSYANEAETLAAAHRLARQLSEREVVAAAMTNEQASDYAAVQALAPVNVALPIAAGTVAACLKLVNDLPNVLAACPHYAASRKTTTATLSPVANRAKPRHQDGGLLAHRNARPAPHRVARVPAVPRHRCLCRSALCRN